MMDASEDRISSSSAESSVTAPVPTDRERLLQMATGGYVVANAIFAAARLGLATALAAGPLSSEALASQLGLNRDALHRVLRALASVGVFSQEADGRFSLTDLSRLMVGDGPGSMRTLLQGGTAKWHQALWGELVEVVQTGEPIAQRLLGRPLYEYLEAHPAEGAEFNRQKIGFSERLTRAVLDAYDLGSLGVLVDVGGGLGHFLLTALDRYPRLRGVLFDLPGATAQAERHIAQHPCRSRVTLAPGDFFERVPPDGDLYVLMNILHNWGDSHCAEILRSCRRAMKPGSRLIAIEMILPERASPHFGLLLDLEMLVLFHDGRERTENQFRALYQEAGLCLTRVVPTASASMIIEGVAA